MVTVSPGMAHEIAGYLYARLRHPMKKLVIITAPVKPYPHPEAYLPVMLMHFVTVQHLTARFPQYARDAEIFSSAAEKTMPFSCNYQTAEQLLHF